VIQKAIERVPAVHIQFIINAFTGQVHGLAMHPYGCRVIQRMLEHCEEPTRSAVLHELHACAASLIIDQYGNYVTQHVIEHGREEDRTKIISLITGNLANLSKHKFASNVVEKSIQFGTAAQRQKIIDILTVLNDKGESPLQSLIRDQYGNYVIRTEFVPWCGRTC
jgi:mRNA-binding protein PUF3